MYEHVTFFAQAKSEGRTWLEAGFHGPGDQCSGKTTSIGIHHRPLEGLLKFSAELGRGTEGKIDGSHFYRSPPAWASCSDAG
jgi:hypothetical protein